MDALTWSTHADREAGGLLCFLACHDVDVHLRLPGDALWPDEASALAAAREEFARRAAPGDVLIGRVGGSRRRCLAAKGDAGRRVGGAVNSRDVTVSMRALASLRWPEYGDVLHDVRECEVVYVDGSVIGRS